MGEMKAQGEETLPESRSKSVQNRDETRSLPQHPFLWHLLFSHDSADMYCVPAVCQVLWWAGAADVSKTWCLPAKSSSSSPPLPTFCHNSSSVKVRRRKVRTADIYWALNSLNHCSNDFSCVFHFILTAGLMWVGSVPMSLFRTLGHADAGIPDQAALESHL